MKVSLNPTYFCNFRCSFCYLTNEQLGDPKTIRLDILDARLKELNEFQLITALDLYGGEVGLMSEQKWYDLKAVIRKHYSGPINVITNLSRIHKGFLDDDIELSVSYDFDVRQASTSVRNNMLALEKEFSVLVLASRGILQKNVGLMISELNLFANVKSVEIKPYSTNQANADDVTFRDFEEFVKQWIEYPKKRFEFVNEFLVEDALLGLSNSFSDDHIYITPSGKFGVLEFDADDNEFFLELDDLWQYKDWTKREKARVGANGTCSSCEYFGKCLSEHLREVRNMDNSCNGFKGLLDWYRDERMED